MPWKEGVVLRGLLLLVVVLAVWFMLNRYILPKLGVPT